MKYVDFREILKIVAKAGVKKETVEIYYPKTEKTGAGWREVEPYSLTADLPPEGEHLIFGAPAGLCRNCAQRLHN